MGRINLDLMEYNSDDIARAGFIPDTYHTLGFSGGVEIDTDVVKFGNYSFLFDGTGVITISQSSDFDIMGSDADNWTIDFFVKHTDHSGTETYINQFEDANNRWYFYHSDGSGIKFLARSGGELICDTGFGGEITDTNWHHVVLIKIGSIFGVYLDGQQVCYSTMSATDTFAGDLYIGDYGDGGYAFDGNMSGIRMVNANPYGASPVEGLSDTITVPTAQHQLVADTKLLLHGNGLDEATSAIDFSRVDCYSESSDKKQGSYALKIIALITDSLNKTFNKTLSPAKNLTNQNTLEFWTKASRTGTNFRIGLHDSGGTTNWFNVTISSANTWEYKVLDLVSIEIANKDAIDKVIIEITNADALNTIYLDSLFADVYGASAVGINF